MGIKMSRGKQQIIFNYLPGRTIDFERVATIAKISNVRGDQRTNLNLVHLLRKVREEARAWQPDFRPVLRDDVLNDPNRFVLINPQSLQAELFPKVFWCQNISCGRVFDYSDKNIIPKKRCPACDTGKLIQLRFVRIHRCGSIKALTPTECKNCKSNNYIALDTRGSERISNFRWICRKCNSSLSIYAGICPECTWPGENAKLKRMNIEVHRAGRTYYAQTTVLLNIPYSTLDSFFSISEWPAIVASKFLNFPELASKPLMNFMIIPQQSQEKVEEFSRADLDNLFERQERGELTPDQVVEELKRLRRERQETSDSENPKNIMTTLEQKTGVSRQIWHMAGHEFLEALKPAESGSSTDLFHQKNRKSTIQSAVKLGLSSISLVSDFPIITSAFGFSRAEYQPNLCRLNPFPPDKEFGGKFPIFVDEVQADALLLRLDHNRVCRWLESNSYVPTLPQGTDPDYSKRAYFAQLFHEVSLFETLKSNQAISRLVFGLIHTYSHLCVRKAALLCGLDRSSLSEYILPRTLSFAIYSNHRFGATIGALTAMFEQSLKEWLENIYDSYRCVYDPVCAGRESSCHACTHLPETSCRFFNLNLSRALLFGGTDPELGNIGIGYFDNLLMEE